MEPYFCRFCLYVFVVGIVTCDGNKRYTLSSIPNQGFQVSVGNKVILKHSSDSPILYVGKGVLNFIESRGNFYVSNYVAERIDLSSFNVTSNDISDVIILQLPGAEIQATMTLSSTDDQALVVSINSEWEYVWLRMYATTNERVFGLGEQYSYLNLRGRTYPIWTREQGVGRNKSDIVTFIVDTIQGAGGDYYTTYFPQPTYISDRMYYCHYTGSNYLEVNLLPLSFHEIFIYGSTADFYFNEGDSIKSVVGALTNLLGRQPELPDWVYTGAVLGIQGGTEVMLQQLAKAQRSNVPVSGLWIQDWAGVLQTSFGKRLFWDWKWNKDLYPNLDVEIHNLKKKNIRVLAYINPNLNSKGQLYKDANSRGYLVKNEAGSTFLLDFGEFFCGIVDMTNPAAYNWYKGVIQENMIDLGFGGWMADFGEYLPADGVVFYNNQSGREVHNQWPLLWAKLNREAIEERNKAGEIVFWTRAGAAGITFRPGPFYLPSYEKNIRSGNYTTLMWAGDQNVDFSYGDGLASTIPAALNLGMSGIGITHFDIGGYTTLAQLAAFGHPLVRTKELLLRSAEAAIFTPFFRTHEGNQPESNVQFYSDDYIELQFGRLASIFVHISNYTKDCVEQNSFFGIPVQRPMFMEFPNDSIAWNLTYQYMFGADVLVAPVIESNKTTMKIYLPAGIWAFMWNGSMSFMLEQGEYVTVPAPLGKPPAFYRMASDWAPVFREIESKFPLVPPPGPPPDTTYSASQRLRTTNLGVYSCFIILLFAFF